MGLRLGLRRGTLRVLGIRIGVGWISTGKHVGDAEIREGARATEQNEP